MDGHPIASFMCFCSGDECCGAVVEDCSCSVDQRDDARIGTAAAMFPRLIIRSLSCLVFGIWLAMKSFW